MNTSRITVTTSVVAGLWLCTANAAQAELNTEYYLIHRYSGKYVCTGFQHNGGHVHLWGPMPSGHENRYRFKLEWTGEPSYCYLRHRHSGKYVCTGDRRNGAWLHLWGPIPPGHEDRYKFQVIPLGDGFCYLRHKYTGNYVCTGYQHNGGAVHLWGPIPPGHEDRYKFQFSSAN